MSAPCRFVVVRYDAELPSLPNLRLHWRKRAALVKAQRQTAKLHTWRGAWLRESLPSMVKLVRVAPRPLDDDNLQGAFKAVRDGVADALGIKDNDPRVRWEYGQMRGQRGEREVQIWLTWEHPEKARAG